MGRAERRIEYQEQSTSARLYAGEQSYAPRGRRTSTWAARVLFKSTPRSAMARDHAGTADGVTRGLASPMLTGSQCVSQSYGRKSELQARAAGGSHKLASEYVSIHLKYLLRPVLFINLLTYVVEFESGDDRDRGKIFCGDGVTKSRHPGLANYPGSHPQ